ncbi:hypothetical protein STVA_44520 [Allostella vacuolata]|nr:hypothetical protein STVA_44520 [Stella vacuolata]
MSSPNRFRTIALAAGMLAASVQAQAQAQVPGPSADPACFPEAAAIPGWGPAMRRTVVVHDPEVFRQADFSLARTLGAIVRSNGLEDSGGERVALLQSMVRSFARDTFVNGEGGLVTVADPRPNEAALDPAAMLQSTGKDGFRPVAVFNRLDLAPDDWSNCGEHRIVYAKGDGSDRSDRMTLIFEAKLRNPGGRKHACRPIAQFWDGLSAPGLTSSDLARRLAAFFYAGDLDGDGSSDLPGGGAVIQALHLGQEVGQVRGNLFMANPGDHPWQLREWRVASGADNAPVFVATTVKENPHPALYEPDGPATPAEQVRQRQDFLGALIGQAAANLTELDRAAAPVDRGRLLAELGAGFPGRFDSFVSISHDIPAAVDDPVRRGTGNSMLLRSLEARLAGLSRPDRCHITPEQLLNRAGAMSCGGCHQFSVGKEIAPQVRWPAALGRFVHVDEKGDLSPALEDHFLPERRRGLTRYLAETAIPLASTAPVATAAGSSPVSLLLRRLPEATTRRDRLELLRGAEEAAAAERRREAARPGAFTPFRRSH